MAGNGEELKEYRQKVLSYLINSRELSELVLDKKVPVITAEIQDELTDNHIYKYAFLPSLSGNEQTYITFELSARKPNKKSLYKNMKLHFYVFSHHKVIKHKTGYLRTDLIDEQIQYLFNENNSIGIGKMYCTSDDYIKIGDSYYGRQMTFECLEQGRDGCN